ncbi:MAG: hydroxymethylglutaryl-CoA lyase [Acidobacteriota bacterium]
MAENFKIIECPRDAWQGLPRPIPTEEKIAYLRALVSAGFRHLDAVSFVSPRHVPQMADSEIVLEALGVELGGVEIIGIVVNEKGMERALSAPGVSTLGYPLSVSPTFQRQNSNQSLDEGRALVRRLQEDTEAAARGLVIYLSMAFGNPYGDPYRVESVAEEAERLAQLGVRTVSLADTAGSATASEVGRLFESVLRRSGSMEVGLHLHSVPAQVEEKVRAAYAAGCRRLDCALTGMGGCPFAADQLVGNLPTERTLAALAQLGVRARPARDALERSLALTKEIRHKYGQEKGKEKT